MKIAYCFFGHARTFRQTWKSFYRNIFTMCPGDIYIHTWSELSSSNPSWWNTNINEDEKLIARDIVNKSDLVSIYRPEEILIEHQRELLPVPSRKHLPYPAYSVKVVYESMKKVFNLASKKSYDRIFMTRMDVEYLNQINIDEYKEPKIYVPPMATLLDAGMASDLWLHGTQEHVGVSTDYFWEIEKRHFQNPNNSSFHEADWHQYIVDKKIPISVSKVEFEVKRLFGPDTRWPRSEVYCGPAK